MIMKHAISLCQCFCLGRSVLWHWLLRPGREHESGTDDCFHNCHGWRGSLGYRGFLQAAMQGMMIGLFNHAQHQEKHHFSDKQLKRINDAYKEIADLSVPEVYEK